MTADHNNHQEERYDEGAKEFAIVYACIALVVVFGLIIFG
jgi:hypothetical protein